VTTSTLWADKKFDFDFPPDEYRVFIQRLKEMPNRIEQLIIPLECEILTTREGSAWSIQEHVGHLADVEELFIGRLDDYESDAKVLRPADMSGTKTHDANHNAKSIATVVEEFKTERGKLVMRLESYPDDMFGKSAHHPRLNKPMRLVDMLYFEAEHDEYHYNRIDELIEELTD